MDRDFTKKLLQAVMIAFALWLGIRYLLPVALPFGLGGLLAISAEPAVAFGVRRLKLPRPLAAGAGVALTVIWDSWQRPFRICRQALPQWRAGFPMWQKKRPAPCRRRQRQW